MDGTAGFVSSLSWKPTSSGEAQRRGTPMEDPHETPSRRRGVQLRVTGRPGENEGSGDGSNLKMTPCPRTGSRESRRTPPSPTPAFPSSLWMVSARSVIPEGYALERVREGEKAGRGRKRPRNPLDRIRERPGLKDAVPCQPIAGARGATAVEDGRLDWQSDGRTGEAGRSCSFRRRTFCWQAWASGWFTGGRACHYGGALVCSSFGR